MSCLFDPLLGIIFSSVCCTYHMVSCRTDSSCPLVLFRVVLYRVLVFSLFFSRFPSPFFFFFLLPASPPSPFFIGSPAFSFIRRFFFFFRLSYTSKGIYFCPFLFSLQGGGLLFFRVSHAVCRHKISTYFWVASCNPFSFCFQWGPPLFIFPCRCLVHLFNRRLHFWL